MPAGTRIRPQAILLVLMASVFLITCTKDDDVNNVNPTIGFRTDSGYTYQSDTVGQMDTLLVGVEIKRGTNAMNHFKVTVSYDGGSAQVTDSLPMGTDEFYFDKTIITRDQPGTERWHFDVVENDGDVIRRALTFTVI